MRSVGLIYILIGCYQFFIGIVGAHIIVIMSCGMYHAGELNDCFGLYYKIFIHVMSILHILICS